MAQPTCSPPTEITISLYALSYYGAAIYASSPQLTAWLYPATLPVPAWTKIDNQGNAGVDSCVGF